MNKQKFLFLSLLFLFFLPVFFVSAGTISSTYKYAWSDNVGYLNFENVIVEDNSLSGYAWSENTGWVNMNPAQGGVINDGNGNLTGSAWGEGLGWIDFGNVQINTTTGKFSGTATGDGIGTLTFDCSQCDVRTDLYPIPEVPVIRTRSSLGSRVRNIFSEVVPQTSTTSKPITIQDEQLVVIPDQSKTIIVDTDAGKIILNIPDFSVAEKTLFSIVLGPVKYVPSDFIPADTEVVNGVFYNITAIDQNGNPVYFFPKAISITLPLPENLTDVKKLAVYWFDEVENKWNLIPDAVFSSNQVIFEVNRLGKFGIFSKSTSDFPNQISATSTSGEIGDIPYKDLLQIPIFLIVAFFLFFVFKNKRWVIHRD